jgi:transposase-like protein
MPHRGPSAVPIVLSEEERAELVRRAGGPGRWRADRARIILACAEGMSNAAAARELGVAVKSVSKWRRQFAADRLAGLEDAAPVGRPKAELILADAVPVLPAWQSSGCSGCWPNRSSRGGMAMVTGATARGNYRI